MSEEIIWCACGDGYTASSYGAGFMDANNGVCANCDAALHPLQQCLRENGDLIALRATVAQQAQMIEHLRGGPTPLYTAVDMADAARDGFRDGRYPATAWRVIDRKGKRFTVYHEGFAEAIAELGLEVTPMCDVPPAGWECSRDKGHEGPCAASEVQP